MAKGDFIEVVAVIGNTTGSYRVTAEKQGRSVESEWGKEGNQQWYVIQERTRGGTVIQEQRCAVASIVAITIVKKEV